MIDFKQIIAEEISKAISVPKRRIGIIYRNSKGHK